MNNNFDYGVFPDPHDLHPDEYGLVALGGRLTPETVCEAYNKGIFPWSGEDPIPWFSPDPRLILLPQKFHRSKSLRKLLRKNTYQVVFDKNFDAVVRACAHTFRKEQDGTWINGRIPKVYGELFKRGHAHSAEVYRNGELVGGLYGLSFGRAFFGESMFSKESNASKIALSGLCSFLEANNFDFVDCQQETSHLASLGAHSISRLDFLNNLEEAINKPSLPGPWTNLGPNAASESNSDD